MIKVRAVYNKQPTRVLPAGSVPLDFLYSRLKKFNHVQKATDKRSEKREVIVTAVISALRFWERTRPVCPNLTFWVSSSLLNAQLDFSVIQAFVYALDQRHSRTEILVK
ncbi:hypothetical protein NPIL_439701 [Nephila pilipes]|uniref:Uncharacterized protein n=1 Tax=Nephila pilipes TaxID=299642 RepID=A0A8X6TVT5_NEPPI|nr:hypothetical protein NPIL_439701 [Nephila pilipes]